MKNGNIMIAREKNGFIVKVEGRANLECSPPLKNFADNLLPGVASKIIFDLSSCLWMDSTFMGTLAIVGLKAKKNNIEVELHNVDQKNTGLIKNLGIENLFKFVSNSSLHPEGEWQNMRDLQNGNGKNLAETILEAHETLIKADSANAAKFEKVIDFVKQDMEQEAVGHNH